MNQVGFQRALKNNHLDCDDLRVKAEHELAAFFRAVTALFGSEHAELSAEEWLRELMASHHLPTSTQEWRLLTIKVTARIASRLDTPVNAAEFCRAG